MVQAKFKGKDHGHGENSSNDVMGKNYMAKEKEKTKVEVKKRKRKSSCHFDEIDGP